MKAMAGGKAPRCGTPPCSPDDDAPIGSGLTHRPDKPRAPTSVAGHSRLRRTRFGRDTGGPVATPMMVNPPPHDPTDALLSVALERDQRDSLGRQLYVQLRDLIL